MTEVEINPDSVSGVSALCGLARVTEKNPGNAWPFIPLRIMPFSKKS